MNIEDQFGLEHLLFEQRKCKICGEMKELINDFYKTRKDREETYHQHMHMSVKDVQLKGYLKEEKKEKR